MNRQDVNFLWNRFENYMLIDKRASMSSLETYHRIVTSYLNTIETKEAINAETVRAYIGQLIRSQKSVATQFTSQMALRSFCQALYKSHVINETVFDEVLDIGYERPLLTRTEYLTEQEQEELLKACRKTNKPIRDYVMVKILLETGLRVSELIQVKVKDVKEDLIIDVRKRKGHHETGKLVGLAIISYPLYRLIQDYMFDQVLLEDYYLFPMTRQGVWTAIKRIASKSSITKNVYPHLLRHTWATNYYRKTKDLYGMVILGGWSKKSKMPERYTHLDIDFLKQQHDIVFG